MKEKMKKKVSEVEKSASMTALDKIKEEALSGMSKKLGSMKKVEVASDSKEGLKSGLEKAKEMLDKSPEMVSEEAMEGESPEMEANEMEDDMENMSLEEVDAKLKELMLLKHKLESKKEEA
jgi:hypothetical protein